MNRSPQIFDVPVPGWFVGAQLAEVVSLEDPEGRARAQVRFLCADGVSGHDGPVWARVAVPFAGDNRGAFLLPDVGDEVLVMFVQGDPRLPVIVGGLWNGHATAPAAIEGGRNRLKRLRSKNGVVVTLDDQDGQEAFIAETPGGQKLTLRDGPSSVRIEDSQGNSIVLESAGLTVTAAANVTVNAAQVKVSAGMITADSAMAKFSGIVQCEVLRATTVIATMYTPGAGNVW